MLRVLFLLLLLLLVVPFSLCVVSPEELNAIQIFYNSTTGKEWRYNKNWMTGDPCENNWFRLGCNPEMTNIVQLILPSNLLTGTLPPELGSLLKLTAIDFDNNNIEGTIPPELALCTEMEALILVTNSLIGTIPTELGLLQNSTIFALSLNKLEGTIPTELGALSKATRMWLNYNSLTGTIPTEFGNLESVDILYLKSNSLGGPIPSELGNLNEMKQIDLSLNFLSGTLPTELGNLKKLRTMTFFTNRFNGPIPSEYGNLEELKTMLLSFNNINSTIPTEVGKLSHLLDFEVTENIMTGTIPTEVGLWSKVSFISFSNNQFDSTLPTEIGQLSKLTCLQISTNSLFGSLPSELGLCASMKRLHTGENNFNGSIPSELGMMTACTLLELSINSLSGTLPSEFQNLSSLEWLNVGYNSLEGTLPPQLVVLQELTHLSVNNNSFQGTLPTALCSLTSLQLISLDYNKFSGSIPSCLGNLPSLEAFAIQSNQMSGPIEWMENFKNSTTILLSGNSLSDYLGPWVCTLSVLDLTNNPTLYCPGYCNCHPCSTLCINQTFVPQLSALNSLFMSTGGKNWKRSRGWLSLNDPCVFRDGECVKMWEGINCVCENANFGSETFQILGLNLQDNNLQGYLPPSIIFPYLPYLQKFNVTKNSIKGGAPFSEMLSLSQLQTLDLSNNQFTGTIPNHICDIQNFDLANNHFTCPLPSCCSNNNTENLCAPCQTFSKPKITYIWIGLGVLVVIVSVVVGALVKRLKEKEAYLEVDEGGGEERAGLLRVPVGGAVEDPHRDRFWWRSEGSSGASDVSDEYLDLCQGLMDSQDDTLKVVRVWHIENNSLWTKYAASHKTIKAKLPYGETSYSKINNSFSLRSMRSISTLEDFEEQGNCIQSNQGWMVEKLNLDIQGKEAFLFHGTHRSLVQVIQERGFDSREAKLAGNFGEGCYFTDNLTTAIQSTKKNQDEIMFLFVVRVSLGFSFHTTEKMKHVRRAPLLVRSNRLCDSVIGSVGSSTEYVVYKPTQCYPELLLEVKRR